MPARSLELAVDEELSSDVLSGLARAGQKQLPSRWLYDELGSILFDAITLLPEYGLTRADSRILQDHASEFAQHLTEPAAIAELGSGTGSKTRWVLEAFGSREPVDYFPIDISPTALDKCQHALENISGVRILPIHSSYIEGLRQVIAQRAPGQRLLVLFLGSTIGNFDAIGARVFLREIRQILDPGDALLLGTDLVKPLPQMLLAYDDPLGVTAAFNLNILARINRELAGQFDLRRFAHQARFNQEESRIEMHLRSLERQTVNIEAIDREIRFERDETIWTEGSYKFRREEVIDLAAHADFSVRGQWIDREWPFAESLMSVE